jgi:hypothetical protein
LQAQARQNAARSGSLRPRELCKVDRIWDSDAHAGRKLRPSLAVIPPMPRRLQFERSNAEKIWLRINLKLSGLSAR